MTRTPKVRRSSGVATLVLILISVVSIAQERQPNPHIAELEKQIEGKENLPAEEVFQNIQIMKGFPAIRVLRIMEMGFSPALGVECSFCHEVDRWHLDTNEHKRVAREMWRMVGGINEELEEIVGEQAQSINCSTCHRGSEKPSR